MGDIKAGVTVMAKFVDASNDKFGGYINYIDRDEAVRGDNIEKFNTYMDYMGNPEKTSALFTGDLDLLNKEQIHKLKSDYTKAQDNHSLMWQTVISFDNRWLAEQGLYDMETKTLDSDKIMEFTRGCMKNILKKEDMTNTAFWSASIHYNTDNIHVHVATSEIQCSRRKQKKTSIRLSNKWCRDNGVLGGENYRDVDKDKLKALCEGNGIPKGRWFGMYVDAHGSVCASVLTDDGINEKVVPSFMNVVKQEESYLGKWKMGSIENGKSYIVNHTMAQQENNLAINQIIRSSILEGKKTIQIQDDTLLRGLFLDIYQSLPSDKRQWNYASNILGADNRNKIDKLSDEFLNRYFKSDMDALDVLIAKQEENYRRAYGSGSKVKNHFAENKKKDLYKRLGNSILHEMKEYNKAIQSEKWREEHLASSGSFASSSQSGFKGKKSGGTGMFGRSRRGELDRSLRMLKRAMEKDIENYRNQSVFRQLQEEIEASNHSGYGDGERQM